MARIEDFGQKIAGAAKDRWRTYADRLAAVPDAAVLVEPLSRIFPEPNYQGLLSDGMNPETVAFLHAIRDRIPAKPRGADVHGWARVVIAVRGLCQDLAEGRVGIGAVRQSLRKPGLSSFADPVEGAMALYRALGHERSFKSLKIGQQLLRERAGVPFDPPLRHWVIEGAPKPGRLRGQILAAETSLERAVEAARDHLTSGLGSATRPRKATQFQLYRRKEEGNTVIIGARIGKAWIDLERFPSGLAARAYLQDNAAALEEKLERLRKAPSERRAGNAPREGRDWRAGQDIGPEVFHATFGFRGVQFGNYVEKDRRQQDLNDAWDALHDLADVLGWQPRALSLNGRLGLAFGARGRGGINAAAAHYEPNQQVINLTKTRGPGSMAHEWFHALDNAMAREEGRSLSYASELNLPETRAGGLSHLLRALMRTEIPERSTRLDQARSDAYWSMGREMAARAFEAWVIDKLDDRGTRNDWLANIVEERVFEAEAALLGQPAGRYPYPKTAEMPVLHEVFSRLFAQHRPISATSPAIHETGDPLEPHSFGAEVADFEKLGDKPGSFPPAASAQIDAAAWEEDGEIDWDP